MFGTQNTRIRASEFSAAKQFARDAVPDTLLAEEDEN